jgi:hypothetical protein
LTVFEGTTDLSTMGGLSLPFVEVSGQPDPSTKVLVADRVEVKAGTLPKAKLGGQVTAIDLTGLTVTLVNEDGTSFTVTYTGTLDASVIVGARVRVKLDDTSTPTALKAAATDIVVRRGEAHEQVHQGEAMEIQGVIGSDFVAGPPATFSLGTQKVSIDAAVVGTSVLAVGSKVELKGTLDTTGVLVATKLEV